METKKLAKEVTHIGDQVEEMKHNMEVLLEMTRTNKSSPDTPKDTKPIRSQTDAPPPVCPFCGSPDHTWIECPEKDKENEDYRRNKQNNNNPPPSRQNSTPSPPNQPPTNNWNHAGQTNTLLDSTLLLRTQKDKIKPKTFDPAKTEWRDYYPQFLNIAAYNAWTEPEERQHLISILEGEARGVFSDNREATLQQLVQLLEERFSPRDREKSYHFQFRARKMLPDEKPEAYSGALSRLARRAYPDVDKASLDKMIVHQFIEGLTDPELHKYVALQGTNDLAGVITACSQYQSYESHRKSCDPETETQKEKPKSQTVSLTAGANTVTAEDPVQAIMSNNINRGYNNNGRSRYQNDARGRPNRGNYQTKQSYRNNFTGSKNQNRQRDVNSNDRRFERGRQGANQPPTAPTFECHYCRIPGHKWRVCRRRLRFEPNWIPSELNEQATGSNRTGQGNTYYNNSNSNRNPQANQAGGTNLRRGLNGQTFTVQANQTSSVDTSLDHGDPSQSTLEQGNH
jgi:hypothetical protein